MTNNAPDERLWAISVTSYIVPILNLFVQHTIDLGSVEKTFLSRASIRPGTAELFKLFADNNIPVVILSAGIREIIDLWCRMYGIRPALVIATALVLNEEGRISGWQRDTLVHALNKSESIHPELSVIRTQRPKALLVGDSMDDASMAAGEQDVLRVRIIDPRADDIALAREARKALERFDACIRIGSLYPLKELIECLL